MGKKLPNRKSIRLKGYDYTSAGLYFVTICTQNREHLFGKINNGQMILNDPGKMIEKWYFELENKFSDIKCGEMVIMPNHFHCIIQNVGADQRVCPNTINEQPPISGEHVGSPQPGSPQPGSSQPGSPLSAVVQWFKTMTTNEYIRGVKTKNWKRFDGKLWQRNYWEHIIRNDNSHHRIAQYIIDNPLKWENDTLNNDIGNSIMEPDADYGMENWNNIL